MPTAVVVSLKVSEPVGSIVTIFLLVVDELISIAGTVAAVEEGGIVSELVESISILPDEVFSGLVWSFA